MPTAARLQGAAHAHAHGHAQPPPTTWLARLLLTLLSAAKLVFATLDSALQAHVSLSLADSASYTVAGFLKFDRTKKL